MPTPATVIATSLTFALVGTLILYIRDLKRRHDPANDDAELDAVAVGVGQSLVASIARRDRSSFHEQEL